MDDRDEVIRHKLLSVRDNLGEIKKLQEEAEAVLKAARAEVSAKLNQMKKEMSTELDAKLHESRGRVEKELALALEKLEAQKQETLRSVSSISRLTPSVKILSGRSCPSRYDFYFCFFKQASSLILSLLRLTRLDLAL